MANVNFKKGTKTSFEALTAPWEAGTFYLITDENRLYYTDDSSKKPQPLSQGYLKVNTMDDLPSNPNKDALYYIVNKNVLASYNGSQWVQINPDTYLQASTSGLRTSSASNNTASINLSVKDTRPDAGSTVAQNEVTGTVTIAGGSNVTISQANNTITINATDTNDNTEYTLNTVTDSNGAIIRLSENDASPVNNQDILIKGEDGVSVERDSTNGNILIKGSVPINGVANSFSPTGGLVTTLSTENSNIASTPIVPTISYGAANGATRSTAVFEQGQTGNPTATLNVYTAGEVDALINSKLASFDAMTYKGTIANETAAINIITATGNNKAVAGDTYKFAGSFTFSSSNANVPSALRNQSVNTGDLFIASGTDSNITWDIVPSGDDQFITVTADGNSKQLLIADSRASNEPLGGIKFIEDTNARHAKINLTATAPANDVLNVTVTHGNAGTGTAVGITNSTLVEQAAKSSVTIPVITSISKDDNGHITAITTQNYKITDTDTHGNISKFQSAINVSNNIGTYTLATQFDTNAEKSVNLNLTSDNLTISKDSDNLKINLEWGTFN